MIALLVSSLVLLCLTTAGIYLRLLAHEEQRQQRIYPRIAQANSESVDWPRPYGSHRTPWRDRRKEIA